jgi:hypothetical protein
LISRGINFLKYIERLEDKINQDIQRIEGTDKSDNFAHRIADERLWFDFVIKEINQVSMEIAKDIESQVELRVLKSDYIASPHEVPFTRLLAMEIFLSAWLGWKLNEMTFADDKASKGAPLSAPNSFKLIQAAFNYGERLSDNYHPKSIKQIIKDENSN